MSVGWLTQTLVEYAYGLLALARVFAYLGLIGVGAVAAMRSVPHDIVFKALLGYLAVVHAPIGLLMVVVVALRSLASA